MAAPTVRRRPVTTTGNGPSGAGPALAVLRRDLDCLGLVESEEDAVMTELVTGAAAVSPLRRILVAATAGRAAVLHQSCSRGDG